MYTKQQYEIGVAVNRWGKWVGWFFYCPAAAEAKQQLLPYYKFNK